MTDNRTENCAIAGCLALADVLPLDEHDGAPYCFDHFELMVERWQAIALAPSLRATLPEIPHRRQWFSPVERRLPGETIIPTPAKAEDDGDKPPALVEQPSLF